MSAIWGIISRDTKDLNQKGSGDGNSSAIEKIFSKMTESMSGYQIDRVDKYLSDVAAVGCGHQYITDVSLKDISPISDKENGIIFVADCFLYYREKLIEEMTAVKPECFSEKRIDNPELLGDAELAYHAFRVFGWDFVKKLRGAFSFAILDLKCNKLHLYTDHFCKRYLAYHITDSFIIFGSTYKPIIAATDGNLKISRDSIVSSYATLSPLNFSKPEITIFDKVFHLDASMHFIIDVASGNIEKEQYWNPRKNVKKLHLKSDEEYKKLFLDTYRSVSEAQLRSKDETGIMLSGGLDSSSVLAMSAPYLKAEGKKIYSYTTVPSSTFKPKINYSVIEDETFLIREQQKFHDNLVPSFIGGDDDNCLDYLDEYQDMYDIPVKAAINNYSIIKMCRKAQADNCRILLSGSNGNASVSYGYSSIYIGLCMSTGHFFRAIHEADMYCKLRKSSRKQFYKNWATDVWNYLFKARDLGSDFISAEDRRRYGTKDIGRKEKHELGSSFVSNERQKRNYLYIPMQYIQKSLYYTCIGLKYGFLQLDPTLTVEIVELCMSLPNECFARDGVERRLICDYMKELLPKWITDPRKGYGVQSSDFNFRINRDWDRIKEEIMDVLCDPLIKQYMDGKRVDELIAEVKKNEYSLDWNTAWYLTMVVSLGYFLRGHKQYL